MRRLLGTVTGARIVDLGCGDGRVSLLFCGEASEITLVDCSEAMLARARARIPEGCNARVNVVQSDATSFKPGRTFDVVICLGVLPHLPASADALAIVASLLSPGAVALVQVTDRGTLLGRLSFGAEHLRARRFGTSSWLAPASVSDIKRRGRERGLVMDTVERHGVLVPGAGRLSNATLLRWEQVVVARPWLARMGASAIVRLRREGA